MGRASLALAPAIAMSHPSRLPHVVHLRLNTAPDAAVIADRLTQPARAVPQGLLSRFPEPAMDIVMKNAPHALPERFVWHRTPEGCELRLDDVAIAEVRPLNAGLVLRVLVEAGDIAPFEMAVRCEERAIGWATQWARQRAGMLCRHVDRQRTAALAAQAREADAPSLALAV
jgi:hypothetical protein